MRKRGMGPKPKNERRKRVKKEVVKETSKFVVHPENKQFEWRTRGPPPPGEPRIRVGWRPRQPQPTGRTLEEAILVSRGIKLSAPLPDSNLEVNEKLDERKSESEKLDQPDENLGEKVHKRKSGFERTSDRIEQYLSGIDRAQTTREISEGLEMTPSTVHGTLQLMEVFGTVQKTKRGSYYYFLKGVYDDEQISAMLPPEKVKPKPRRRRSILRSSRRSEFLAHESLLEEHLSSMRMRANLGEGPSALAMIGLTQQEMTVEEALTEELPRALEVVLKLEERTFEPPRKIEPFATVEHLPKDARRINSGQIKHLKEQLKGLDVYDRIERFTTAFAEFSALKNGSYGTVFYFSMGTNSWEQVYKVTVDESLSLEMKKPRGRGRSKYDPMIDRFIESGHDLVEIGVKGRNPDYIASQLRRRIEDRGLEIAASSVGGFVYLENKR